MFFDKENHSIIVDCPSMNFGGFAFSTNKINEIRGNPLIYPPKNI